MKRPNILLITTDTQRCDTLRCMGNAHAISPNLDRLAEQGVLFSDAYTTSPVCCPARTSLLTGVHAPVHGCIENGIYGTHRLTPFTDHLAAGGYHNILVGKSHFTWKAPESFHVRYELGGEKNSNDDDFYGRHLRRHGYDRATRHPNPVPENLFCEAFLADTLIETLAHRDASKPFFAFLSMLSPHSPFDPPGRWESLYTDDMLPPLNYREGEVADHPAHQRLLLGHDDGLPSVEAFPDGRPDMRFINEQRRRYYGLAAYCDAQVGRVMQYLDAANLRKDTLVIFTSDHGTTLYDHGIADKHCFYDSSWRVPLILSMPGTLPTCAKRDFAVWTDVTATILAAAGCDRRDVQGFDLLTPLSADEPSPRRCGVGALYRSAALVTKRWKLEYYFDTGCGRLFDRQADPLEQTDLYDAPAVRLVRDRLLNSLLHWRSDLRPTEMLRQWCADGGGPTARRVVRDVARWRGVDTEERLNEMTVTDQA